MFERISSYINKRLIECKKIPLFDICVYKDHKLVYRHFNGQEGVCENELLCMFSMTKPITSILALRLMEEGKIKLEDSVSCYLPDYKDAFVLDEQNNKIYVDIKIKHLFTMTSGLDYDLNKKSTQELKEKLNNQVGTIEIVNSFIREPLKFSPGDKFEYGLSLDVLGAVIEKVSGKKLSDYADEIIFKPLKMTHSTLKGMKNRAPKSYIVESNGVIKQEDGTTYNKFIISDNYESGGAGLISTVGDYIKFADALACGGMSVDGYRLLKEQTINLLRKDYVKEIVIDNNFTCAQGDDYGYGLGVRVRNKDLECGLPQGEFGWDGAAGSFLLVDMNNKISVVIGMNILSWPYIFSGGHLEIVEEIYNEMRIQ